MGAFPRLQGPILYHAELTHGLGLEVVQLRPRREPSSAVASMENSGSSQRVRGVSRSPADSTRCQRALVHVMAELDALTLLGCVQDIDLILRKALAQVGGPSATGAGHRIVARAVRARESALISVVSGTRVVSQNKPL